MDFRVGQWLVRPALDIVVRDGWPCHISPKAMDVLVCLANRRGNVVAKDEIFREVWSGTFVSDDALTRSIGELRRAFHDDAKAPAIIQTVAKRGYLILAPVVWEHDDGGEATGADLSPRGTSGWTPVPPAASGSDGRKRRRVLGMAGLVSLLTLSGGSPTPGSRTWGGPVVNRIAVLPLANLSGDPAQDYFADGMTEALITELAQIRAWKVISRTSVMRYRATKQPLRQIARDLAVDGVLEGTVLQSGGRVRITAQLIDAATDHHLWSQSFESEVSDVLTMQSGVARAIAQELQVRLNAREQARLNRPRKVIPEAYEAYLKGWYFFNRSQFLKAASFFEQATTSDPSFAMAHALLFEADSMAGYRQDLPLSERALKAIGRARELDDTLAEVHDAWGDMKFFGNWDWTGGEAEYRRAVELDPGSIDAAMHYCLCLHLLRRWDAAMRESKRELQLDPVSPRFHLQRLRMFVNTHQYGLAMEQFHKLIEVDPNSAGAYAEAGGVYATLGKTADALAAFLKADALSGKQGETIQALEDAARTGGWRGYWEEQLAQLQRQGARERVSPVDFASVYVRLGKPDEAIKFLEAAYQQRSVRLPWINAHAVWDPLRSDHRFQSLLRRMGFPD
jgi:TolB-like protein/DNA-binding winged helix-turn-helix (wHTH) protein